MRLVASPRLPGSEGVMASRRTEAVRCIELMPSYGRLAVFTIPRAILTAALVPVCLRKLGSLGAVLRSVVRLLVNNRHLHLPLVRHLVTNGPSTGPMAIQMIEFHMARMTKAHPVIGVELPSRFCLPRRDVSAIQPALFAAMLTMASRPRQHRKSPSPFNLLPLSLRLQGDDVLISHATILTHRCAIYARKGVVCHVLD